MVFRYPTRFFACKEFELKYRTENGIKIGSIRHAGNDTWQPIVGSEVEKYINKWYLICKGRA